MACIVHDVEIGVELSESKIGGAEPYSQRRSTRRRAIFVFGLVGASALAALALLVAETEDLSSVTLEAARRHHHTVPRELLTTLEQALHHEINVEVEVTFGEVNLSRQVLFGDMDNQAIYASYYNNTYQFWGELRQAQRKKLDTLNFVVAKADSHIVVNGLAAAFNLNFMGAVNARYMAMAFDGDGELDRSGKIGGFSNWYFDGVWQREEMHVTFFPSGKVRDSGTCESNGTYASASSC